MVAIGCWLVVAMFVRIWFRFGLLVVLVGLWARALLGLGLVALVLVGCLRGCCDALFQGVW